MVKWKSDAGGGWETTNQFGVALIAIENSHKKKTYMRSHTIILLGDLCIYCYQIISSGWKQVREKT